MNAKIPQICLLALLCFSGYAHAITLTVTVTAAQQVGETGYARTGLVVTGESSWTSLTVGGGFTLDCGTVNVVLVENTNYQSFIAGYVAAVVHVPVVEPADYNVGGFPALQAGHCRSCSFQYRGRVLEGQAGISAGTHGVGFTFNIGGVELTRADTRLFQLCKPEQTGGGGCIP